MHVVLRLGNLAGLVEGLLVHGMDHVVVPVRERLLLHLDLLQIVNRGLHLFLVALEEIFIFLNHFWKWLSQRHFGRIQDLREFFGPGAWSNLSLY